MLFRSRPQEHRAQEHGPQEHGRQADDRAALTGTAHDEPAHHRSPAEHHGSRAHDGGAWDGAQHDAGGLTGPVDGEALHRASGHHRTQALETRSTRAYAALAPAGAVRFPGT